MEEFAPSILAAASVLLTDASAHCWIVYTTRSAQSSSFFGFLTNLAFTILPMCSSRSCGVILCQRARPPEVASFLMVGATNLCSKAFSWCLQSGFGHVTCRIIRLKVC